MMDYISEDDDTDRMSDEDFTPTEIRAMLRRYDDDGAPMTEAERDRIIKQISKEIEAMDDGREQKRTAPGSLETQ